MGLQHHGNLVHNHPKLQRQKTEKKKFLLLSDRTTYSFSKMKMFTVTILSQNYHWTDGFSLKNHPLKEAEKQYKFCFRAEVDKGCGGLEWGVQNGATSDQVSTSNTVMQLKNTYMSVFRLSPREVRNDSHGLSTCVFHPFPPEFCRKRHTTQVSKSKFKLFPGFFLNNTIPHNRRETPIYKMLFRKQRIRVIFGFKLTV